MAVYFFYGDEDYNIEQEIEKLKKTLDKNFSAMNFQTYNNPKYPDFIALLRTQPMMFGKMMIVINAIDYFSQTLEDWQIKEISSALELCPETLDIVITAILPRNEGKKLDSRRKIFKLLTQFNSQEFPTLKTYKIEDISAWLKKEAKKRDLTITQDAMLLLIEQIGNNLREFCIELDKLKLLAHPEKNITKQMVKDICITNQDLFNFTDFILKGQKDSALKEFYRLIDKKHPLEILSALQTMLRRWITIKMKASSLSAFEISKLVGQHEFVVKETIKKMKNTSIKTLVSLKHNLTTAEYRIKTGESFDTIGEIQNAIIL